MRTKFCPDNCQYLLHSPLSGGSCDYLDGQRLKDYDINATLVKYKRHEFCPLEEDVRNSVNPNKEDEVEG